MMRRYWVCKAAQEHVNIVRDKNYTQINMGPRAPLEKMSIGDWILYYSPTVYYEQEDPICEKFTGISCVTDKRIYPQGGSFLIDGEEMWNFSTVSHNIQKILFGKVHFLPEEQDWKEILKNLCLK